MAEIAAGTPVTVRSGSADATRRLGEGLGRLAEPGDVFLLQGDLGAGKTTFTQGFAVGAGTDELVNSPTFVLMNEYRGRLPVYHADLYRLDTPEEVAALDLANASLDGALLVEWPERGDGLLPTSHLLVQIELAGIQDRVITLVPRGERAEDLLQHLPVTPAELS
ncbi:MAG: tRNA (adenosine(37)-N6)-threonylcarbamoyltransferase complex ATPase subunit type 1 TsaE [Dehalococcoidia bacterium]